MQILRRILKYVRPEDCCSASKSDGQIDRIHSINQRIFETSQDLILVVSKHGEFLRVSPSVHAILGFSSEELVGHNGQEFIHPDDLQATREEMRILRRGRPLRSFNCRYVHRQGTPVPLVWTGVWSREDEQYFFIGRDATAQITAEKETWRRQQLEAITQLTGGVAHDFNNLLAVIVGSLEMLDPHVRNDLEASEHLLSALHAALRGGELTKQLLAYSRQGSINAQETDINTCVDAAITSFKEQVPDGIEIKPILNAELWAAHCEPRRLADAIIGLYHNAAAAMAYEGTITVETDNRRLALADLRDNTDARPGEFVMIAVSDTGAGMSAAVMARILEPYFTTKPEGSGAGLGLSIIYGFIRQMHGHIEIESVVGHGSTIRLFVPRIADHEGHGREEAIAKPTSLEVQASVTEDSSAFSEKPRILVVEDNQEVRRVVLGQLKGLGYQTFDVTSAEAAIDILKSDQPVDMLFSDVLLPGGMSGADLAEAARLIRPKLRILLTSGYVGSSSPIITDTQNFLSKPYRRAELATAIEALLGKRRAP